MSTIGLGAARSPAAGPLGDSRPELGETRRGATGGEPAPELGDEWPLASADDAAEEARLCGLGPLAVVAPLLPPE